MNTASQNLPQHLGVLRERMLHPTDFETAVSYFLEEFAGDEAFVRASEREDAPQLIAVLRIGVSKALGKPVEVGDAIVSHLTGHHFFHGHARAEGRVVLFFYFQDLDTGILMVVPGAQGQMDIARFRVSGGLPDPRAN